MHSRRPPSLRHKRNPRDMTRKMRHSALENDDDLEQQQHQQQQQQQQQLLLPSQAQHVSTTSTTSMRKKRKAGNSLFKTIFLITVLFLLGLFCKKYILNLNQSRSNLGNSSPILQGIGSVKNDKAGNMDSTNKEKMDDSFNLDQRKKDAQEEKPSKDLVKDQTMHVKDEKEQGLGV
jgi:cytoskeletal protein RodZ